MSVPGTKRKLPTRESIVVLVCGGRHYEDYLRVDSVLKRVAPAGIIEGGALGADKLAYLWGRKNKVPTATVQAHWDIYGKEAGPLRNEWMLRFRPDLVIAFPGGKGTASMVALAKKAGVKVLEIP